MLKHITKRLLPTVVRKYLGERSKYEFASFSQEGEDRILAALLGLREARKPGFYVDVGAHHPERFSNTLIFYNRGWRGINIGTVCERGESSINMK